MISTLNTHRQTCLRSLPMEFARGTGVTGTWHMSVQHTAMMWWMVIHHTHHCTHRDGWQGQHVLHWHQHRAIPLQKSVIICDGQRIVLNIGCVVMWWDVMLHRIDVDKVNALGGPVCGVELYVDGEWMFLTDAVWWTSFEQFVCGEQRRQRSALLTAKVESVKMNEKYRVSSINKQSSKVN